MIYYPKAVEQGQSVIEDQPQQNRIHRIYLQKSTSNKSFLDMHMYLKSIGIKNNAFMLALLDPDLAGVNPHDPNLNTYMKQKILLECLTNYFYWLRECVRLPSPSGAPMKFNLNRGNMAYFFCNMLNLNSFYEAPRQLGKTTSVVVRNLYIYLYGATNSKIAFLHKNAEGSRDNLQQLKDIRDLLPEYLQFKERPIGDGKFDRGKDNTTAMVNPFNNNSIRAYASATTKARASSLLRGKSLAVLWYDEYAFLLYNQDIYLNAAPALKTVFTMAKKNGAPYGVTITTTPGFCNLDGNSLVQY